MAGLGLSLGIRPVPGLLLCSRVGRHCRRCLLLLLRGCKRRSLSNDGSKLAVRISSASGCLL